MDMKERGDEAERGFVGIEMLRYVGVSIKCHMGSTRKIKVLIMDT